MLLTVPEAGCSPLWNVDGNYGEQELSHPRMLWNVLLLTLRFPYSVLYICKREI